MCSDIIEAKPDLVVTEKGVSDLAQHYLQKAGISVLRRVRKTDNNRIARASGATIVHRTGEIRPEDLGTGCGLFTVEKIGDEYYSWLVLATVLVNLLALVVVATNKALRALCRRLTLCPRCPRASMTPRSTRSTRRPTRRRRSTPSPLTLATPPRRHPPSMPSHDLALHHASSSLPPSRLPPSRSGTRRWRRRRRRGRSR